MDYSHLAGWVGPPVLGAFIGYLTNKVAIRMLFRPLKPCYVFGVRVPMTPGVIPAKRGLLAENIGEMVGSHLLTGKDIGGALSREPFQDHLRGLIDNLVEDLLDRNLGSVSDMIPRRFRASFRLGIRSLKRKLRGTMRARLRAEETGVVVSRVLIEQLGAFGETRLNDLIAARDRGALYEAVENIVFNLLEGPGIQDWLTGYMLEQSKKAAADGKRLVDLLPESSVELIYTLIREQTPVILRRIGGLLSEPPIRERIIRSLRGGIDNFLESLGPFGAIASFFDITLVEEKLRSYLDEKEESIVLWLQNPEVRERVARVLVDHAEKFLRTPVADLLAKVDNEKFIVIVQETAAQLLALFRSRGVRAALSRMLRENLEAALDDGDKSLSQVAADLLPPHIRDSLQESLTSQTTALLRSERVEQILGRLINSMVDGLVTSRVGVLREVIPDNVRGGITDYISLTANRMLLAEVPGLIESLDIRRVVADKVDTLDLLKLERLLLSIMEEQFKYINLFGALLGFMIGLLNLLIMKLT